jgi:hypothetical protein
MLVRDSSDWDSSDWVSSGWDSDDSSARHEIEDEYDDGENQKDVNPASQGVAANESHDPEDEEDNRNCPKHFRSPIRSPALLSRFAVICGVLALTTGKVPDMRGRLPMRIKYEAVVSAGARYFD